MDNLINLELLTPGSQWKRENGRVDQFLMLTNTTVPAKHQHRHPQMAVFARDDGDIFSVLLDDFLDTRTFQFVAPELERRLNDLLAFETDTTELAQEMAQNEDEDDDDDALVIHDRNDRFDINAGPTTSTKVTVGDDDDGEVGYPGDPDSGADDDADDGRNVDYTEITRLMSGDSHYPVGKILPAAVTRIMEFVVENPALPVVLTADELEAAVIGYTHAPFSDTKTQHTIAFKATELVTRDALYSSFAPSQSEVNAVYTFNPFTPEGKVDADWDYFGGVYPMAQLDGHGYMVVFYTNVDTVAPAVVEPVAVPESVAPAVEVVPTPEPTPEPAAPVIVRAPAASAPVGNTPVAHQARATLGLPTGGQVVVDTATPVVVVADTPTVAQPPAVPTPVPAAVPTVFDSMTAPTPVPAPVVEDGFDIS